MENKDSAANNEITCLFNMSEPYQKELAGFLGQYPALPPFLPPSASQLNRFFSGGMFHYNPEAEEYGIDHKGGVLFRKVPDNPLMNDFGFYVLSKLHKFQNMKSFLVNKNTDLAEYIRYCTTLHDGTVVYRFSKELLATLETLVAFCPYYAANDHNAAAPMDNYYAETLADLKPLRYDDIHTYLEEGLREWYDRFKPLAEQSDSDDEAAGETGDADLPVGTIVAVSQPGANSIYSLKRRQSSSAAAAEADAGEAADADTAAAAPRPAAAAAAAAAPAAADATASKE